MRVISNRKLLEFSRAHPGSGRPLKAWRKVMEKTGFNSFADLKATFNTVDKAGNYYVFNVGGNNWRIITAIHFNTQKCFIRHVYTHAEYNRWKP